MTDPTQQALIDIWATGGYRSKNSTPPPDFARPILTA
jgi:hypothetical protein